MPERDQTTARALRAHVRPLTGAPGDYDALLDDIGDARFVLLGEASHGTHEFYRERARITRRLIEEKGFCAVAVEADWPHAQQVAQWVTAEEAGASADEALHGFERFPTWMWRNTDVLDFVRWLRGFNEGVPDPRRRVGFFGLDLYSLFSSMQVVLDYLGRVDPEAARRARERYACFDHFGEDTQGYGYLTALGLRGSCESEVVDQLLELTKRAGTYARRDGLPAEQAYFDAEQNARLVRNAERYYREMFLGNVRSWNLRDRHMAEVLQALARHYTERLGEARIAVWAHNSHLGDARATERAMAGELNLGQLVREEHGEAASFLVGCTTYTGSVTAADDWGDPPRRMKVRPGMRGSIEELLHHVGPPAFHLPLRGRERDALAEPRLERAIGVIYRPETERQSHYFHAQLADQFDAVLHFDVTHAVRPLDPGAHWEPGEVPETYPSAV